MFRFPIHDVHDVSLEFSEEDLSFVHKMAFDFQLYYLTLADLHENLHLRGHDGLMSYQQFYMLFKDLGSSERDDVKLSAIFRGFDRTESGYVDITELTCGLSILCQGSKSSKLLFAFRLLDEDKDEYLTRRGIWRFIRSFLCVLLAISSSFNDMTSERLNALLDDLSVLISSEILANDAKRASFDMISSWYSTKGYLNSTWIELLDLKKWIAIPDGSPRKGDVPVDGEDDTSGDDDDSSDDSDSEDDSSESSESVDADAYAKYVANRISEGDDATDDADDDGDYYQASLASGHSLVINAADTAHVLAVSTVSGLANMEPREMVDVLSQFVNTGTGRITQSGFLAFLNNMNAESLASDVRNKVFSDLFAIFNLFEKHSGADGSGAEFRSLAVGLTMLCKGTKSLKLEIGFRIFEEKLPGGGRITSDSLFSFLASYLLVLSALDIIENSDIAVDTALTLSRVISEMLDDEITFPSFGKWYNVEGYNYAPWIELLNLEKWEKITGFSAGQRDVDKYYLDGDDEDDDEEDSQPTKQSDDEEEEEEDETDAFSIILNSHSFERKIAVSKQCASKVFHFTRFFASSTCEIAQLVPELQAVSQDGLIGKEDFLITLNESGFNNKLIMHGRESFATMLFDAFDRSNSGYCDISDIVTGVVLLDHQGTKSEKLVFAFDFIDTENKGTISKREIWKFFRSFLITVVLLSCPEVRASDYLHMLADESAVWVVESILNYIAKDSAITPSDVSFDDIAEWYSATGCSNSAWIELLDFSKWIYLSS